MVDIFAKLYVKLLINIRQNPLFFDFFEENLTKNSNFLFLVKKILQFIEETLVFLRRIRLERVLVAK